MGRRYGPKEEWRTARFLERSRVPKLTCPCCSTPVGRLIPCRACPEQVCDTCTEDGLCPGCVAADRGTDGEVPPECEAPPETPTPDGDDPDA